MKIYKLRQIGILQRNANMVRDELKKTTRSSKNHQNYLEVSQEIGG